MPNHNEINIIGHVGGEPEARSVGQSTVYSFSVAVNRGKNKDGESYGTDWFRVEAWNKEWILERFGKGDLVFVSGSMHIDKNNEKIYPKIRAFKIYKLREAYSHGNQDNENLVYDESLPESDEPPF